MMSKQREEMMSKVIRIVGFKNEWTIWFCQLCEDEKMTLPMLELALDEVLNNCLVQ